MNHPLRWGILATGVIAKNFAETAAKMGDVHIAAVSSRSLDKANEFADAYGIPARHEGVSALAADPDVDIVYVATPHSEHLEHALLAIGAGKHVLVEKPMTPTADEARQIVAAAREAGVFCMEAMWTRFLPHIDVLRQVLQDRGLWE